MQARLGGRWIAIILLGAASTAAGQGPREASPPGEIVITDDAPMSAPSSPGLEPAAAPPFQLSPVEEAGLAKLLALWQESGQRVSSFECDFTRWHYNQQFGPPNHPFQLGTGKIRYSRPDKGLFRVEELRTWDPARQDWGEPEAGEYWVCDGKALFELEPKKKLVTKRVIPEEMRGQAIAQGPLPFLFHADADQLRQRYWMRLLPPRPGQTETIRLEAYPRWRQDAANYRRAELILSRKDLLPQALMLVHPNDNSDRYLFTNIKTNQLLQRVREIFRPPTVPLGWKLVEEPIPGPAEISRSHQGEGVLLQLGRRQGPSHP